MTARVAKTSFVVRCSWGLSNVIVIVFQLAKFVKYRQTLLKLSNQRPYPSLKRNKVEQSFFSLKQLHDLWNAARILNDQVFFFFSFFFKKIWGLLAGVLLYGFHCIWFSEPFIKCTVGGFGGAGGFVIYDETATNNENKANKENDAEDKENM